MGVVGLTAPAEERADPGAERALLTPSTLRMWRNIISWVYDWNDARTP